MKVVLSATSNTGFTNALQAVAWNTLDNATVEGITGASPGGKTTLPNAPSVTFFVKRVAAGEASTVRLTVTDSCGDWPTFVGGGPSAF